MINSLLIFLGFSFAVFELVRHLLMISQYHRDIGVGSKITLGSILAPYKLIAPKLIQVILLITVNIVIIVFYPDLNIYICVVITSITLVYCMVPVLLESRLSKHILMGTSLAETKLPEIIHHLNWDRYSKARVQLKKAFIELTKGQLESSLAILEKQNEDKDLYNYYLWHQDVLKILLNTRNINLAYSYLTSLRIDTLNEYNIPSGILYSMVQVYSEFGNFREASLCLRYLDDHYHDVQHRTSNLTMYLIFYALGGSEERFNALLERFPRMNNLKTLPYWRAILLMRLGHQSIAMVILGRYIENLPPEHQGMKARIQEIINTPDIYKPINKIYVNPLDPDDGYVNNHDPFVTTTITRSDSFKNTSLFTNGSSKLYATLILSAVIVIITVIQFILGSGSFTEFIIYDPVGIFDFIKLGGFNTELVEQGQWIRYVTSIFMHGNWIHLLSNIFGLIIIGRLVEKALNSYQMVFIFMFSGIMGNVLTHIFHEGIVGVGASGGVFGILGAFLTFIVWRRRDINSQIYKRLIINFVVYMGIQIFFGLSTPQVNNTAHIGGLIGGVMVSCLYLYIHDKFPKLNKRYNYICGLISLALFISALVMWYPIITYDYFGTSKLTKELEHEGYSLRVPNSWRYETQESSNGIGKINLFIDDYSNSKIYLENRPLIDYDEDTFRKDLERYVGSKNNVIDNLSTLDNGWISYSEDIGIDNPKTYDIGLYYYKKFHNSMALVTGLTLEEFNSDFQSVLLRVIDTLTETEGKW